MTKGQTSVFQQKRLLIGLLLALAPMLGSMLALGDDSDDSEGNPLPVWRFILSAGVSSNTANYYGGLGAVGQLITNQIETVNHRFNEPHVFKGTFQFVVAAVYEFSGSALAELVAPHPDYDYKLVYDGFSTLNQDWFGPYLSILHSWPVTNAGGLFGETATDGLVHEFGHSRGAIDLYGLEVDPYDNPLIALGFAAPTSIMTYPYGVHVWDEYSTHLINENADVVNPPISYVAASFPKSIGVSVLDVNGNAFPNAKINLYPVGWFQSAVSREPVLTGSTDSKGQFEFANNPFVPNSAGEPWDIRFPNFLVSVQVGPITNYGWLPLDVVQNSYFDHSAQPYRLAFPLSFVSFDSWRVGQFGADGGNDRPGTGPLDYPQQSGVPNLLAYALALDPHEQQNTNILSFSIENGYFTATYTRRNASLAYDVVFKNQYARGLGMAWSEAPLVQVVDHGDTETVKFRDPLPTSQSNGGFFRVVVEYAP